MSEDVSKAIWVAVVSGLLAVAGIGAKGVGDIYLEKSRLDSQLIVQALGSPSVDSRRESLRLLVEAGLVSSAGTREALKQYFEGAEPRTPPQVAAFVQSGEVVRMTPSTIENSSRTDIDLFVCGARIADKRTKDIVGRVSRAIDHSGHFGSVSLQVWDGSLYEQIAGADLAGFSTLIVDASHPESNEAPALRNALQSVLDMPPLRVVGNAGPFTRWRLALVVCPK